jgi:hypothetical protein
MPVYGSPGIGTVPSSKPLSSSKAVSTPERGDSRFEPDGECSQTAHRSRCADP